jgi:hypothetical protein
MKSCRWILELVVVVSIQAAIPAWAMTYNSEKAVTIQAGGAGTTSTIGPDGSVQSGYATVTVDSGSAPYATAVMSLTQNGTIVSEVGVPASPPTLSARIFVEYRTGVASGSGTIDINTGIAAVNMGTSKATISLLLRDLDGNTLSTGSTDLDANEHLARYLDGFGSDFVLPADFAANTKFGSLEITSDQPLSILAMLLTTNQGGDAIITTTPIADLSSSFVTTFLNFPQVADGGGYQTALLLLNTSNAEESGVVNFYNSKGEALEVSTGDGAAASSQIPYQIKAGGTLRLATDGSSADLHTGWAQLVPTVGSTPVGAGVYGFTENGILVTESGVPATTPTTHARVYIDQSSGHNTGLAVVAVDDTAVTVGLQAYLSDGTTAAGSSGGSEDLAGHGYYAGFIGDFIPDLPEEFTGVLDIQASTPFAALTMRSLNNSRGEFLATTFPTADVNTEAPTPILFPQIAAGGGYKSEFVFLNTNEEEASVTIKYLDGYGAGLTIGSECTACAISGTISGDVVSGITMTISGAGSGTVTTSSSGEYSFTSLANGVYTVTPSLSGYAFSPPNTSVTISYANANDVNFTSASSIYSISGAISGDVVTGVTMTLSGAGSGTATTGSSGEYSFTGLSNGTYTVTPSLSGYAFSPASTLVNVSGVSIDGINFASVSEGTGDRTDYDTVSLTSGGTYSSSTANIEKQYYLYTSTTADNPAIKVGPGGSLTLTNSKVTKSGSTSSTENSGFYGFNSGVLASSSSATNSYVGSSASSLTMTDSTITTGATGANGAFAFGERATVTLDHVTIVTTGDSNSRGVDATYGGTVNISNSKISTIGGSSAALATDRYENYSAPKINATNVEGTTAGAGSPGIYSTGTFTVTDSKLSATGSEAAVIEGLNSITLNNSNISGVKKWGVMIYQSMSGDSSKGTGTFNMTGGTLTNNSSGPLFFICNTKAVITLDGATLTNATNTLLKASTAAAANDSNVNSSWGTKGGTVTFTASNQTLEGDILLMESSSSIDLTLSSSSTLTGGINTNNKGTATLVLDSTSKWTATTNSYLETMTLSNISSIDAESGSTITVGAVSGVSVSSPYTLPSGGTLVVE